MGVYPGAFEQRCLEAAREHKEELVHLKSKERKGRMVNPFFEIGANHFA